MSIDVSHFSEKRKSLDTALHLDGFEAGARRAEAEKPSKCGRLVNGLGSLSASQIEAPSDLNPSVFALAYCCSSSGVLPASC